MFLHNQIPLAHHPEQMLETANVLRKVQSKYVTRNFSQQQHDEASRYHGIAACGFMQDVLSSRAKSKHVVLAQVIEVVKGLLGIPLVNIGGLDILYGQRKLIMGLLWQLMRLHLRRLLQGLVRPQVPPSPNLPYFLSLNVTSIRSAQPATMAYSLQR